MRLARLDVGAGALRSKTGPACKPPAGRALAPCHRNDRAGQSERGKYVRLSPSWPSWANHAREAGLRWSSFGGVWRGFRVVLGGIPRCCHQTAGLRKACWRILENSIPRRCRVVAGLAVTTHRDRDAPAHWDQVAEVRGAARSAGDSLMWPIRASGRGWEEDVYGVRAIAAQVA